MEFKKQDILKIISEQHSEVDEMAGRKEHGYETKGRSVHDIIKDKNGNTVGFKMMDYTKNVKMPVLTVCGDKTIVQSILDENPEMIAELKEEFGEQPVYWTQTNKDPNSYCIPPRSSSHQFNPLPGEENDVRPYIANTKKPIEKTREVSTKLKRILQEVVDKEVGELNVEATKRLQECSVPVIYGRDIKHLDRHSNWSNQNLRYQTHNFNIYNNANEFLEAVQDRIVGNEASVNYDEKHMRRRYNNTLYKWNETRRLNVHQYGGKTEYKGKTDVYDVDYMDFNPGESGAAVFSELTIDGALDTISNMYHWKATFIVKFGDALNDELKRKYHSELNVDKTLVSEKVVTLPNGIGFNENTTVLDSRFVYQGLVELLVDLREKFNTELDPISALGMAAVPQSRLGGSEEEVNENILDKIMNKIMKQK
jgi:hypothetical protein